MAKQSLGGTIRISPKTGSLGGLGIKSSASNNAYIAGGEYGSTGTPDGAYDNAMPQSETSSPIDSGLSDKVESIASMVNDLSATVNQHSTVIDVLEQKTQDTGAKVSNDNNISTTETSDAERITILLNRITELERQMAIANAMLESINSKIPNGEIPINDGTVYVDVDSFPASIEG